MSSISVAAPYSSPQVRPLANSSGHSRLTLVMPEHRIQILKAGTWPSSAGLVTIDNRIMSEVVSSYDPSRYRAPLCVTHRLPPGQTERTLPYAADISLSERSGSPALLSPNGLAYGAPTRLERRPDGGVDAVFDRISPCFVSWVRNGNLLSVSPGLYRPTDIGNPTPGHWALRHCAALGSEPPAAKGMQPLALSEFGTQKETAQVNLSGDRMSTSLSVYHPLASLLAVSVSGSGASGAAATVPSVESAIAQRRRSALVL